MQSNIVHLLTVCGLTEEFATVVATKYASEKDEMAQNPVPFVQDYWYANNREALGELFYFHDTKGMREALLKLSVKPQVVTQVMSAPHNEELFLHRDAIEWASMVIDGQRKKAFRGADH
ncbi:unnamed protein product [Somion occarium]|uniref:Uncharacterized protein n=1 Tax=Somion occarium TaxID=3059160 RepID=A0ABP1DYJ2_9APHY